MSDSVNPCVTCGMDVVPASRYDKTKHRRMWHVGCRICHTRTTDYMTKDEAVYIWNKKNPKPDEPLSRCPFCGGRAHVHKVSVAEYYVMCTKCLTTSNNYHSERNARDAWNRRVNDE